MPFTPHETLVKECNEEASIDASFVSMKALPAGTISYFRKSHAALLPKIQYVYDIFLPTSFQPVPRDGEVQQFSLMPLHEV